MFMVKLHILLLLHDDIMVKIPKKPKLNPLGQRDKKLGPLIMVKKSRMFTCDEVAIRPGSQGIPWHTMTSQGNWDILWKP